MLIKLSYITGLRPVVVEELSAYSIGIISEDIDSIYIAYTEECFDQVKKLRSITKATLCIQSHLYNPIYIFKHKSILNTLIDIVIAHDEFKTFKISCAGSDSPEVKGISAYIKEVYRFTEKSEADLKIHIIKPGSLWEIGVQITPRPLSLRKYKVAHMSGAMDPTIAYAMNSLANLDQCKSYLNICSGSGTLLIEAVESHPNIQTLVGFDNNKKHISLSIQNIKKAGYIRKIQIKEADIFDKPDLGTFDVIVSDVPFGMSISKHEDLKALYASFVAYCEGALQSAGKLVVYTSEYKLMESILSKSDFEIIQSMELVSMTHINAYLRSKIIVAIRR